MSNELDIYVEPEDPTLTGPYPRGLALDLVLEVGTLKEILDSYNLTPEAFKKIMANSAFRREYEAHKESMDTEGWSFRKKCQAQAELYLNLVFRLTNSDHTPAAVRADLIRHTVKWAGLDSPVQVGTASTQNSLVELAQNVKSLPDGELEMRVLSVILRKNGGVLPPVTSGETYDN